MESSERGLPPRITYNIDTIEQEYAGERTIPLFFSQNVRTKNIPLGGVEPAKMRSIYVKQVSGMYTVFLM